jgi:hypothetical protein
VALALFIIGVFIMILSSARTSMLELRRLGSGQLRTMRFRVPLPAVVGSNSMSDAVDSLDELLDGRGRRAAGIGLL